MLTTPHVADGAVGFVEAPRHAHGVHLPVLVVASLECLADDELSLRRECIGHGEIGIDGFAVVFYNHLFALIVKLVAVQGSLPPLRVAP